MELSAPTNREHIPAKSFYPKAIRRNFNLDLDCLQVHVECNKALKLDEEYFIATFGPAAADEPLVGTALMDDLRTAYKEDPKRRRLGEMVLREFGQVVGTDGSRLKSYDSRRTDNVLWKIVRGLALIETNGALVLRPNTPKRVAIFPNPDAVRNAPGWLPELLQGPPLGRHSRVLDYRVVSVLDHDDGGLQMAGQGWALLLWNRIIATVFFHVPVCPCPNCIAGRASGTHLNP